MAKPKLALIPATQGSKLYSVLPADGVGDFNFSRDTIATRINKDGLIETVASGKSRLNYPLIDGVVNGCPSHLLEPQRTNLLSYSEDFSQSSWIKTRSSIGSNSAISPDGTLNADKLIEDTSTNTHSTQNNVTIGNVDTTISVFVKSDTRSRVKILLTDLATGDYRIDLNLNNLSVIENNGGSRGSWTNTSYKIENFTNNWYKVSLTATKGAGSQASLSINLLDNSGNHSYTGDGTSGVYIYGAQLEQGSYATSIIPTSGSAVTRSAETAIGAGDASTFNDSEGVLMVEMSALANDSTNRYISLSDGSTSNRVNIFFDSSNNLRGYYNGLSGSITINIDTTINNKIAFKYKSGDSGFWVNGIEVATRADSLSLVGLESISFDLGGGSDFYGNTKQIQYFDSALNDSDLETLTSWTSFTDMANGQLYSIK